MSQMTEAMMELANMDALAKLDSPIHRIHPLAKLITTIAYILIVVSFPRENVSGMIPMVIYPLLLFSVSGISVKTCFYKLRYILPLICAVGIWNPLLDRVSVMMFGGLIITSGMISFVSLMLKGILSLMASFLLVSTTGMEHICYALSLLKVPDILVTQLLITYRYISLLLKEAGTMWNAYSLRAPGQKGLHISTWGSFVGQLLIRSMDRAGHLYQSMEMRGFHGAFYYAPQIRTKRSDIPFLLFWIAAFLTVRFVNISVWIGNLFVR